MNNDGKLDLVAGDTEGNVFFYKNVGTAQAPRLAQGIKLKAGGKEISGTAPKYEIKDNVANFIPTPDATMGIYSKLHVTDWNGDKLPDILVGHTSAKSGGEEIVFYKNTGTPEAPAFAAPVPLNLYKEPISRPSPFVVDWDGDGKRDVILGTENKQVMFLQNTGTNEAPAFAKPAPIALPGLEECYRCRVSVVDWNNDGKLDLLVGNFYSGTGADKQGRGGHVWLFLRK